MAAMTTKSVAGASRKTGISVIGDRPWGTHFCRFYETKRDLLDTLVPYFKAGLENNEFCLCALLVVLARRWVFAAGISFGRRAGRDLELRMERRLL